MHTEQNAGQANARFVSMAEPKALCLAIISKHVPAQCRTLISSKQPEKSRAAECQNEPRRASASAPQQPLTLGMIHHPVHQAATKSPLQVIVQLPHQS